MASKVHRLLFYIWLVALLAPCSGTVCGFAQQVPVAEPAPTPLREADAICGGCHQEIVRRYIASPMANGSGLASDRLYLGKVQHAASGVAYQINMIKGEPQLRYERASALPLKGSHKLQYFLGSGRLGTTYLYNEDGYLFESPVAFYSNLQAYDMAPGLAKSTTMPAALPITPGCMRCHMSGVQVADAGTQNHFSGLPFLHGGITCEECHGDSAAHVASRGQQQILNPTKLEPVARDSVCINCHLEGDTSVEHKGRSVLDYRVGERIADYVTYFVLQGGDSTDRSVSEVEELNASRCKRASGTKMSCMSCHDPHGSPAPEARVAFYRRKCLACHSQPGFAASHFPATLDCTTCHMPRSGAQDTPHVAWTDHRIRRKPQASLPVVPGAGVASTTELTSVLGDAGVSSRDLALAYYKLLLKGQTGFAAKAWTLLNTAVAADRNDPATLVALGYMNQMQGRAAPAIALYQSALRLDPTALEAANDLGTLLAQSGRIVEARELWQRSFARHSYVESLGVNLSIAQCQTGDRRAAEATLEEVLYFSPDALLASRGLSALRSADGLCPTP